MNHKGHDAATAAHKGEHKKIRPLCPLRLCGSIVLDVLRGCQRFINNLSKIVKEVGILLGLLEQDINYDLDNHKERLSQ
ncbi:MULTISPECIES: hypothetical protein [Pelosinus]|jgi:hypothetical protein|uniref:hypothetical protein n=1 Tax=Pelosinus TaxID=365348 RepID=UPI0002685779|nr:MULTISPECIES: hypothetical protein [Pelosinus]